MDWDFFEVGLRDAEFRMCEKELADKDHEVVALRSNLAGLAENWVSDITSSCFFDDLLMNEDLVGLVIEIFAYEHCVAKRNDLLGGLCHNLLDGNLLNVIRVHEGSRVDSQLQ